MTELKPKLSQAPDVVNQVNQNYHALATRLFLENDRASKCMTCVRNVSYIFASLLPSVR